MIEGHIKNFQPSSVLWCWFFPYFLPKRVFVEKNVVVTAFITMSPRVLPVSVDEHLVVLHLHYKISNSVTVWNRDVRELEHKAASNLRILLTFVTCSKANVGHLSNVAKFCNEENRSKLLYDSCRKWSKGFSPVIQIRTFLTRYRVW